MQPTKIASVIGVGAGRVQAVVTTPDLNLVYEDLTYRIGQIGSYATIAMDDRTILGFVTESGRVAPTQPDREANVILHIQLLGELQDGRFTRGINEYPIVGDEVHAATRRDFEVVFGSFKKNVPGLRRPMGFSLGRFAFNTDFEVQIRGSSFLAKHVAVLGNSGSGKSCTTARILQEILDLRESQIVLFDMHGEYRSAFSDEDGQLNANVTYLGVEDLVLPYWLLKYEEMEALFVDHSNPLHVGTQISFLRSALLEFKMDAARELGLTKSLTIDTPIYFSLDLFKLYAENLNEARYVLNEDHLAFSQLALRSLEPAEQQRLMRVQRCQFNRGNPEGETPHPLYFSKLLGLIDRIDTLYNDRRFQFMLRPLEHGRHSKYFRHELAAQTTAGQSSGLMNHLIKLLTGRVQPRSNLTIIDMSGIPFEIVDITVAVLTRLLFDVNFWTPADERHPILLAYEESHNYIPRREGGRQFAKRAVERVAKEGRKYGVSAMVISQRPSELSETVLAQCNNFVVMRISNPDDQVYVRKVVGDQFAGVVEMLPVLRPGEAFIIGDAVLMPMRTLVDMPHPAPQSSDADFYQIWSASSVATDIDQVIDHWRRQDRHSAGTGQPRPDPVEPQPAKAPAGRAKAPAAPAGNKTAAPSDPDWSPLGRQVAIPARPKKSRWLVG